MPDNVRLVLGSKLKLPQLVLQLLVLLHQFVSVTLQLCKMLFIALYLGILLPVNTLGDLHLRVPLTNHALDLLVYSLKLFF